MKRYRENSVVEDCELNGTSKCYNRNLIHNEWERIQNLLIARLANKIRVWTYDGTDQSKQDLYHMLDASVVALKAQYQEFTQGLDIETAARRRAEYAVNELGLLADRESRLFAASAGAQEYIMKDQSFR